MEDKQICDFMGWVDREIDTWNDLMPVLLKLASIGCQTRYVIGKNHSHISNLDSDNPIVGNCETSDGMFDLTKKYVIGCINKSKCHG